MYFFVAYMPILPVSDPDVLDTWFSSGLFPFAMLGWPERVLHFLQQSIVLNKQPYQPVLTTTSLPTDH